MAVGTGAGGMLLNLLWGDPTSKVAAAMAPPNPAPNVNPLNQPGASPSPSGGQGAASGGGGAPAAQPAPGQAPAQTYGPDPTNAQNIQTLMEYQQRADSAASLNRHLAGIAAGFGTAQQQHDKLAAMAGLPTSSNALGGLSDIQKIQGEQLKQGNERQFQAGAALLIQQMHPDWTPEMVRAVAADPNLSRQIIEPTDTEKNLADWEKQARASGMSEADIAQAKADMIAGSISRLDPLQKEFAQAWRDARKANPGKSDAEIIGLHPELESTIKYSGAKIEEGKASAIATTDRVNAAESFHSIDPTLKAAEDNLAWLKAHPGAVVRAIHTPGLGVGGVVSAVTGLHVPGMDKDTLDARSRLDWLKKNLYADRFTGTKNIRSNTEANNLGAAASNVDNIQNSDQQIVDEINRLYDNAQTARGNLHAAAGKEVPAIYRGKVDDAYFDPKSPLYNHATWGKPAEGDTGSDTGGAVNAPPEAIAHLKLHPELAPAFDAKFGAGASKKVLGQ